MSNEPKPFDAATRTLAERRARVEEALQTGDRSSLRSSRDLSYYSSELARSGRWGEAESVALSIEDDPAERDETLAMLSQQLAKHGASVRAAALAAMIPDDSGIPDALQEKVVALMAIAKSFEKGGDGIAADDIVGKALTSLNALAGEGSPWLEPEVFLEVGRIFYGRSNRERALEFWRRSAARAEEVSGDVNCLKLLGEVGAQFAEAGEIQSAKEIMNRLPPGPVRQRVETELQKLAPEDTESDR